MAATIATRPTAKILPFRRSCAEVNQTDSNRRLPTLSSADIESFFDNALTKNTALRQAV